MRAASVPRILAAAVLLVAGCASGQPYRQGDHPVPAEGGARFIVFDVGQADAMLVIHRGRALLIDAGVARDRRSRQKFRDIPRRLEALTGRRHLDYLVVTHYHADHIGLPGTGRHARLGRLGLWDLLADEGVTVDTLVDRGGFVIGPKGATQEAYEGSLAGWLSGPVKRRLTATEGMTLAMGPGLRVEVVAVNGAGRLLEIHRRTPRLFEQFPPSENDYSIALKFTLGDFELFAGGDLTGVDAARRFGRVGASYNDIESRVAARVGDVEVYRVDHHGSSHSSNPCFVRVLSPEVSIISAGDNGYGHPALRVYEALKQRGRVILTGGADRRVRERVHGDIAGHDVEVVVEPGGTYYSVEGRRYRALTDTEERARGDFVAACQTSERVPATQPAAGEDQAGE